MDYTWHDIHTLWQKPLEFITSHALYSLHHTHYIWHLSTLYDVTFTMCVTSLYITICLWFIHFIWHHAQCYDNKTIVCLHSHYACHYTQCIFDITQMYQFYEKKQMYVITASICMTTYALHMTSHPFFKPSHHFIYDVKSTISNITSTVSDLASTVSVITPTLSMISQPAYVLYHIQCTCDILSTIFRTSYPLCMTTQHCVLFIPHSAYVWHNLHYRWYHIHSITPNHSIYDVTSTSGMTLHPLYQRLHPLYLCHHNLSTDITPTFEWHHTHLLCDIICTI